MPNLQALLDGRRLIVDSAPLDAPRATLLALDATLGVAGAPQSATGQAVLLTGRNLPRELGYHYGPKPNPDVAAYLRNGNLFRTVVTNGQRAAFLNAYPDSYFAAIASGHRLYSAIPLAASSAGVPLMTTADLFAGRALAADLTGEGWRDRLNLPETPVISLEEAGRRLANLAALHQFTFFEYWLTDYAGHGQDLQTAVALLEDFDQALGGLLAAWDDSVGLILLTSDHGNLEDLTQRGHTRNPVPALVIGNPELRSRFASGLHDLTDIAPAIQQFLGLPRPADGFTPPVP